MSVVGVGRIVVFLAGALATYVLLVAIVFIAGGLDMSCASDCASWERWMDDHQPWPVVAQIAMSLIVGLFAASRLA